MDRSSGDFSVLMASLSKVSSTPLPSLAGYRGFLVTTTFTDGTVVMHTFGKGQQASTSLEIALLNSNGGTLSANVQLIALAGINGQVFIILIKKRKKNCLNMIQLLLAKCDIGVRFSVHPFVRPTISS